MSWNDVSSYIKTQLKPGVLGNTDVQKILNAVLAIVNQIAAGSVDPQNDALWKPDESYAKDVAPVLWMDQWLVSNVPNNTGNVPISTSGTVHPTWRVIGASSGGGIAPWSAIIYPNVLEIVFFNGGLYYLDRSVAGDAPFVSTNFSNELADDKWKPFSGEGGGGSLPGNILAALTAAVNPSGSNPFATVADLPEYVSGNRIIKAGTLTMTSATSALLEDAEWEYGGVVRTYTGTLTFPAKPTSPDNQFVIIRHGPDAAPLVKAGVLGEDPAVPNPDNDYLVSQTVYRPHDQEDVVAPVFPKSPSTALQAGLQGKYAPIWRQTVKVNAYYGFKISFLAWSSEYGAHGQYPLNGIVLVNLVTKNTAAEIDPNRTSVRVQDIGVDNGDFVLVQTGATEVTLFARKKSYLGNMVFKYLDPRDESVLEASLVRGGTYGDLPTGPAPIGIKQESHNGTDYVNSSLPVRFDIPRQYGFISPITGAITFPANIGDALNPGRVNTGNVAKVRHNASTEPPIDLQEGVWKRCDGGTYVPNVNNDYYLIAHKNAAGTVIGVSYTITQNIL